ncbi:MAG: hypothetical protein IJV37_00435 [Bacteroidales bacterium]|nr:hypothetical protein [Bacteroidales bacterium]
MNAKENKLFDPDEMHYAVTHRTAAEIIYDRAGKTFLIGQEHDNSSACGQIATFNLAKQYLFYTFVAKQRHYDWT